VPSTEFAAAALMAAASALTFIPRDIRTIRSAAPATGRATAGDALAEDALVTDTA
jgi:hypothetical protein